MAIPFDIRQSIYRGALTQSTEGSGQSMESVTTGIDSELTQPLRIRANIPATQVVLIENAFVANPNHSRKRTIPPIGGVLTSFSGGTITVPTSSGGNLVPSVGSNVVLTLAIGYSLNVGVNINAAGQLVMTLGAASLSTVNLNPPFIPQGCRGIGYFNVQNVGGVIQPVSNGNIVTYSYAPVSTNEGAVFDNWGTTVTSTPYTVSATDSIIPIDTTSIGSPMVINLPAVSAAQKGRKIVVKDVGGNVSKTNKYASVVPNGTDSIEGVSGSSGSIRMDIDRMALTFVCDGVSNWYII